MCPGPADAAALAEYQRPKPRDAPYTPTTLVGARLPHVAISVQQPGRLLAAGGGHDVASTVDLAAAAGTSLVLLMSDSPQQVLWEAAATAAEAATGVPVLPVVITQGSAATSSSRGAAASSPHTTVVQDVSNAWLSLRRIAPDGALLVRPDGHIAWRAANSSSLQSLAADLERVVRVVMAKQ